MKYFHGFSLTNEEILFEEFIPKSTSTVAGFSYGAQAAFEYVYTSKKRIDRLILLSPAYFQTNKPSFVRTQLRYFDSGKDAYIKNFLANVIYPSQFKLDKYVDVGSKNDLELLLKYVWDETKMQEVLSRGTSIEVFLGEEDKILDIQNTISFFSKNCTTYIVKKSGHILKENLND